MPSDPYHRFISLLIFQLYFAPDITTCHNISFCLNFHFVERIPLKYTIFVSLPHLTELPGFQIEIIERYIVRNSIFIQVSQLHLPVFLTQQIFVSVQIIKLTSLLNAETVPAVHQLLSCHCEVNRDIITSLPMVSCVPYPDLALLQKRDISLVGCSFKK